MSTSSLSNARQAAQGKPMDRVARTGLAARGGVYVLFGVVALLLATGNHSGEADQRGALQALASNTAGAIVVWILAIGLFAYALWRFAVAAFGSSIESEAKDRLKALGSGVVYLLLGISAVKIAAGAGGGSQAAQQQGYTAKAMQHTGGRWLVAIVGIAIIVAGGVLVYQAVKREFEEEFDFGKMTEKQRRGVVFLGVFGSSARGVVLALAGVFFVVAAVQEDPKKGRGLDGALHELQRMTGGPFLLGLVAIGLIAFGVFGFAQARWSRTGVDEGDARRS